MVKIRLTRTGRKNHAAYRLIAIDSRKARDSKAIEFLGHYLPHEKQTSLAEDRIKYWLSVGAQPSDTVARLLVKEGVLGKESLPAAKKYTVKPGRKSQERAEKAAQAAAQPAAEEPVAEAIVEAEAASEAVEAAAE